jgi:glycosyltransferase involved in cell wall biosynthesis
VQAVRVSGKIALLRAKRIIVLSLDYVRGSKVLDKYSRKLMEVFPPNRFEGCCEKKVDLPVPLASKKLVFGFVGRFVEEKGIQVILDAATRFKGEDVVFWLAGDHQAVAGGTIFAKLKSSLDQLGEQVVLLGKLTDEQLAQFYKSIDILLLPSVNRFEAFGMVQLEAMSFGALVVTSDMAGVRESVRRTGMGELSSPGSVDSLVEAMRRALAKRSRISREEVVRSLRAHFANEDFKRAYSDLIEEITI